VNAIIQNGGEVLFVDVDRDTLNASTWQVMDALSYDEVGGVVLAHTLGFPFNEQVIYEKCKELGKWFISDTCDCFGSTVHGNPTGYYSHANTYSFYPAHQLSCGEGGAVLTDNAALMKVIRSYAEWGRSCWCDPGCDNTCGKRFSQQFGELPDGYDHKYVYERLGYNLKMSDLQAALGVSQMDHLNYFVRKRRENYAYILDGISGLSTFFDTVSVPAFANPSPFGFPLIVKEHTHISKSRAVKFLESRKIMTRPIFGGNLTRQPAYLKCKDKWSSRWVLSDSDYIMENGFWVGCHPGLNKTALDYIIESLYEFSIIIQGG
jgi:CDP-6-deoxy-D-xylo-4-hexulose-3-dehydrase